MLTSSARGADWARAVDDVWRLKEGLLGVQCAVRDSESEGTSTCSRASWIYSLRPLSDSPSSESSSPSDTLTEHFVAAVKNVMNMDSSQA